MPDTDDAPATPRPHTPRLYPQMNPEWKAKLLEALRSGKYPQSKYRLRNDEGYCVLGVACDIVDPNQWILCGSDDDDYHNTTWAYNEADIKPGYLTVWRTGTLTRHASTVLSLPEVVQDLLVCMNDGYDKTFAEIADWIEAWL